MNTGETIALIKAFGKGGGGLPAVTPADNGKVLAVKDGAWAADENTIILPITNGKVELTGAEINALVEEGKTVMLAGTDEYDVYAGKYFNVAYFVNMRSTNSTYKSVGSNKNVLTTYTVPLPPASASDNGSELIVRTGAWVKQQKKFVVTLTPTAADYSGTMDKTPAEITAAYGAGQEIVFDIPSMSARIHATQFLVVNDVIRAGGMVFYDVNGSPVIITLVTDSSASTYATQIFAMTPAS